MTNEDLSRIATHRWRRYATPTLDYDDIQQIGRIAAWRLKSSRRDSIIARVSNATRNAIRDDKRARNPSCGPHERVKSSAFVSTAVHDEAICGVSSKTVEDALPGGLGPDVATVLDVRQAVSKLPPRLRSVIERRYLDGTDQDQRELAATDGVTRQAISLVELQALERLRKMLR